MEVLFRSVNNKVLIHLCVGIKAMLVMSINLNRKYVVKVSQPVGRYQCQ